MADAQVTIFEQYTIVRVLNSSGVIGDVGRTKLREMLGGPDIEGDEKNLIARNTQFELYIGAKSAPSYAWAVYHLIWKSRT